MEIHRPIDFTQQREGREEEGIKRERERERIETVGESCNLKDSRPCAGD